MLFLYPHPYPFKDGSHDESEYTNSLKLDGTKINDLTWCIDTTQQRVAKRKGGINTSQYLESERPAKGEFRKLAIRFSIYDNVNILTLCSKTIHTKFTKPASF